MYKKLYPLKFTPIEKERPWGSESWTITSMEESADSEVAEGFLAESTLGDVLETYMGDLVGDNIFENYGLQFPLLVKTLHVKEFLSVQVHPDDKTAFERFYEYGKSECWYVVDAEPTAKVYMGFKRDTSASEFYDACKKGTVKELMNEFTPKAGDSFFIPSGTVHACGGGLTIAEVQEPSDVTFRLYDWGREFDPKTARTMHLDEAIDCIDYKKYDEDACRHSGIGQIADCERFTANIMALDKPFNGLTDKFNSCVIFCGIKGEAEVTISGNSETFAVKAGECILIPASADDFTLTPKAKGTLLLESHIRHIEEEPDDYINPDAAPELNDGRDEN